MITRQIILQQINAYLNHELSLAEMVNWAENALIEPNIPEDEEVDRLMDIVMYLGAADTRGFPLTWDILSGFVEQLGGRIHATVEVA